MKDYWKIIDFSKEVGKHYNTVDSWFKRLEERKLHYVNRVGESQEKIYDNLDLEIAHFIVKKRDQKWALDAIFDQLVDEFELRPFPIDEQDNSPGKIDIEAITQTIERIYEQKTAAKIEEMKKELLNSLPKPVDPLEERQNRVTDMITQKRVEYILREEARNLWSQKPESERMKKVGWFRKEEDFDKREQFIREYIHQHFEERLKKEYEL
ncbi:hypothetical protein [Aneurinibacillus migulanus]|uniref:MerR family transcriptional regulator n=1 Tax=Aneurinibacillus migulanus TaxID=47500 RepID=A0A0M0GM32_ANEMI|nr:hypothetical protein [Aneurinibacillus migulanus]KON90466.1 hypothetical protein AF333_28675 [Aneurinibacillus migulanus]MED0894862.1 MerR family transcriptional regulator [Aneurinibacillus migulanus]MED1614387.1 MerR family transcriptional regulator [Aneurinibacillus migulanus]SDJ79325.1 hypothetical protein SAMN04487909_128101 [Aneurinibacillus migulanus]GED14798.1 hypothetical protein AMI01nite_27890 [Aneurinibacillus migulanus]